eukprot:GHVU01051195.1.p1 GENE.GHVU01051195.1~~GHVU01051195.1.p1  ORF type:complete len:166 (+),score=10.29 GHVU01051195.1:116-613(+)
MYRVGTVQFGVVCDPPVILPVIHDTDIWTQWPERLGLRVLKVRGGGVVDMECGFCWVSGGRTMKWEKLERTSLVTDHIRRKHQSELASYQQFTATEEGEQFSWSMTSNVFPTALHQWAVRTFPSKQFNFMFKTEDDSSKINIPRAIGDFLKRRLNGHAGISRIRK